MLNFNSRQFTDTVLPHSRTGDNVIRSIIGSSGRTVFSRLTLSPPTPVEYHLEWRGDFNGDNHTDSLWRNYETGENIIGLMEGNRALGGAILPLLADSAWQARIVADFTGDGQLDIVWYNADSGNTDIWVLARSQVTDYIDLPNPLPEWKLFPAGDVDGNGTEDFHWCNPQTGENMLWRMEGFTVLEEMVLPKVSDRSFPPDGIKDFDFTQLPNKSELECPAEEKTVWQINRANMIGSRILASLIPDAEWEYPIGSFDNFLRQKRNPDSLFAASGSNLTSGSSDRDLIYGNTGNDTLVGHDGDDIIFGGSANDYLDGGLGNDLLSGDAGNDTLLGGLYSGLYLGGWDLEDYYRDWICQDTLTGGAQSDTFVLRLIDHQSTPPSANTVESYYTTPPLPTPDKADRITDFQDGIDRLVLPQQVGFQLLSIEPLGDRGESTFIYAPYLRFSAGIPAYSAAIAVIEDVSPNLITAEDFVDVLLT